MNIITQKQLEQLKLNGSPEKQDEDHLPVVKLVLPGEGCTWLLTEVDPEEPTLAFGLCDLCIGFPELGYVSLEVLESICVHDIFKVECDLDFKAKYPVSVYAQAARIVATITFDDELLKQVAEM